jgi:hypothetical protein
MDDFEVPSLSSANMLIFVSIAIEICQISYKTELGNSALILIRNKVEHRAYQSAAIFINNSADHCSTDANLVGGQSVVLGSHHFCATKFK